MVGHVLREFGVRYCDVLPEKLPEPLMFLRDHFNSTYQRVFLLNDDGQFEKAAEVFRVNGINVRIDRRR